MASKCWYHTVVCVISHLRATSERGESPNISGNNRTIQFSSDHLNTFEKNVLWRVNKEKKTISFGLQKLAVGFDCTHRKNKSSELIKFKSNLNSLISDVCIGPGTGGFMFSSEMTSQPLHSEELETDLPIWRANRLLWSKAFLTVAAAHYLSSLRRDDSVIIAGRRLVPTAGNNHARRLRPWFLNKASWSA